MSRHLTQLSDNAEHDEDIALQLASEMALNADLEKLKQKQEYEEWAMQESKRYIVEKEEEIDHSKLDQLAEEIGF